MRIVVGIGGNALLQRGQPLEIAIQLDNIRSACKAIASISQEHEIIITHGNGPQIGLLALQAAAYKEVSIYPFDVLGAESQGMIGYLLAQELMNQLPKKKIAALLTQVEVSSDDPAFSMPTKFIGPLYNEEQKNYLAEKYHWSFAKDGDYFRRVLPSPLPRQILDIETIKSLINSNRIIICVGGGGIPVIKDSKDKYSGAEAVIDKDFATALLADQLHADRLLLLTDVAKVIKNWRTTEAVPINAIHYDELETMKFESGSMGPKVDAACQFVKKTKNLAHIGLLTEAKQILQRRAGTTILP